MPDLTGKIALVTGGTSGIGAAAALAFADAGAHVVLTGRREKEGEAVAQRVRSRGVKGLFVRGDVSKDSDVRRAVDAALSLGRLDIAFNNAGIEGSSFEPLHLQTEQHYDSLFNINIRGVFLSMKHEIAAMLRTGGGAIVNNASIAGSIALPGMSLYVATKHAVIGLTRAGAIDYAKQHIRVNAVSPAAIETDMIDRFVGQGDERQTIAAMHPVGRMGKSEEVAAAVVWLCSPAASFVTGHDLLVDGGFTAQ